MSFFCQFKNNAPLFFDFCGFWWKARHSYIYSFVSHSSYFWWKSLPFHTFHHFDYDIPIVVSFLFFFFLLGVCRASCICKYILVIKFEEQKPLFKFFSCLSDFLYSNYTNVEFLDHAPQEIFNFLHFMKLFTLCMFTKLVECPIYS